ncbi:MAG: hypothetical protein IH917_11550 [Acidobacteria bacterium]|nr:hypothetical protein [Acidobacteriota bacterium]
MIAIILLLLFIAPAWSLAQETEEISLVEAARRERERRASITVEVKILTNRDVEEMEGLVSTAIAPETSAEVSDEAESDDWGELFDTARLDLQTAENRLRVLQLQMVYLRDQWLKQSDGVTQQKIQVQLQETQKGLEISRQEIEAAGAAYQELQEKAAAAGLLPGELRDLMGDDS